MTKVKSEAEEPGSADEDSPKDEGDVEEEPKPRKPKPKHSVKGTFSCPMCPKVWGWPWELRRHVITHYKQKEKAKELAFKCDECGKPFQCALCGGRFTQPANLRTHMKKKHKDDPAANSSKCPHCGVQCPSVILMHQHMIEDHQMGMDE